MSQAGGPSSGGGFGEARIDFTANTAPLEAGAAKAVETTKQAATQAQVQNERLRDSYQEVGKTAEEAGDKANRSWKAAVTGVASAVATFFLLNRAIQAVITTLETGASKAASFFNSISGQSLQEQVKAARKELSELEKQAGLSQLSVIEFAKGLVSPESTLEAQVKEARERLEKLVALEKESTEAAARNKKDTEAEAQQARVEALKERVRKETAATLEGIDRIKFEEESRIAEINKLREKASDQEKRQLDEIKRLIGVQTQREIDEFKRKEAEKRQEAAATALAIERAFTRALGQVQQQSASLFTGDQVTAQLERVASLLEQIADQRSMIGGRD